jgi:hypothetical protein
MTGTDIAFVPGPSYWPSQLALATLKVASKQRNSQPGHKQNAPHKVFSRLMSVVVAWCTFSVTIAGSSASAVR